MTEFFDEIEHYINILLLAAAAKQNLNTITMRSIETVNKYYHKLFKLWKHTNTSNNKRINKFKLILKLSISHTLFVTKYNSMKNLLELAKSIEDQKKKISSNFPQDQKPTSM